MKSNLRAAAGIWEDTKNDLPKTDEELWENQKKHLEKIWNSRNSRTSKAIDCLHNRCSQCVGTGVKKDGTTCIHMISCPCSRCNPHFC